MTQREAFEAWWGRWGQVPVELQPLQPRTREDTLSAWVWEAWQAAQAAQPAQQLNWSELAAWWESGAEQWDGLKDIVLRMVHPAQAPAGYKWVPLEPTPEMCEAYLEASLVYWVSDEEATTEEATAAGYRAAIAAAPEVK